jgi:type VI secretion system protein ImpB
LTFMDGKGGAEELIAKALNDSTLLQSLAAAPKPAAETESNEAAGETDNTQEG